MQWQSSGILLDIIAEKKMQWPNNGYERRYNMAGIMIASKTEHNTTMLRLLHEGKIIDRMEVESLVFLQEHEIAGLNEEELQILLTGEKGVRL